ncbi:multidrug effflux MFS transporter [Pandoraea sp. PE-S2R-1]|uniref:multidrug effflux MFS transporter n=1 Tax=Pandoraea sp. PE-S2R-1 TaxID=1986994 RepID=UPI000B4054D7|nr:multidrug effflux MFS transporter [Pandoraea sp. PE-S2R-1]
MTLPTRREMALPIALLMFPQIAETIYSPALVDIGEAFGVGPAAAASTLSVYFFAFAIGVVVWGRMCDVIGRRPTMLFGLAIYALACVAALFVDTFGALLAARVTSAFGAAVGSVATQTILRDRYQGPALGQVFSMVGMALAVSPAIGMFSGAVLAGWHGYVGVFGGLAVLAVVLLGWSVMRLPETRPPQVTKVPLFATLWVMLRDFDIWRSAALVALFNTCLFSYYSLAPFMFERLGVSTTLFGYSGLALALGSGIGASLNKRLLARDVAPQRIVMTASVLATISGAAILLLSETLWFLVPVMLLVVAFGLAIPNILSSALARYRDRLGTGGAVLGLYYYLLIGAGLTLSGMAQTLGGTYFLCGLAAVMLCATRALKAPRESGVGG